LKKKEKKSVIKLINIGFYIPFNGSLDSPYGLVLGIFLGGNFSVFCQILFRKTWKNIFSGVNVFVDQSISPSPPSPPKGDQHDILNDGTLNFTIRTSMDKMFIKLYKCNHFSYSHEYEYEKKDNATMSIDMAK
jgi:hypothetical protein